MKMEKGCTISLICLGLLALLFQGIGLFVPAWLKFKVAVHTDNTNLEVDVSLGLWTATACVHNGYIVKCAAFSMDKLESAIGTSQQSETSKLSGQHLLGDITVNKVLATLGGASAIFGMIIQCVSFCSQDAKNRTRSLRCVFGWGISAVLVLAAVGLQAKQNATMQHEIELMKTMPEVNKILEMELYFPWAIVMSGLGAFLATVVAVVVSLRMCNMNSENMSVKWSRVNNPMQNT